MWFLQVLANADLDGKGNFHVEGITFLCCHCGFIRHWDVSHEFGEGGSEALDVQAPGMFGNVLPGGLM